jgi:hypothetical protein
VTSNRRVITLILVGIAAILVVLTINWFGKNFARKDVEKQTGYSLDAKQNIFLAAEYYLHELGHDVESDDNRARFLEIPLNYQTIFLNDYGPKLSSTHFKNLNTWIENGGHLIFTANDFQYVSKEDDELTDYGFRHNQLLKEYGIHAQYTNFSTSLPYPSESTPTAYTLSHDYSFDIYFEPDKQLIDTYDLASVELSDLYGTHLLQLNIGKGKLTVLSDNQFLDNAHIGNNNHAYLLSYLMSFMPKETESINHNILLLYNNESDSIFSLIWNNGKHAFIAFIALIILFLWSLRNRFGPIIPNLNYANRNITEHLKAIGQFSWRQDHGKQLLNHSRVACENGLFKRYPALKNMPIQERLKHISDLLDIEQEKVHSALYFEPTSTNEFINSTHHLQKLWILQ